MNTATEAHPAHAGHGKLPPPEKIDPIHDIDGKITALLLAGSTVFVFGTLWLLFHMFAAVIQSERAEKVENAPTELRDQLRVWEDRALQAGSADEAAALPARPKSIDQAIDALSR